MKLMDWIDDDLSGNGMDWFINELEVDLDQ